MAPWSIRSVPRDVQSARVSVDVMCGQPCRGVLSGSVETRHRLSISSTDLSFNGPLGPNFLYRISGATNPEYLGYDRDLRRIESEYWGAVDLTVFWATRFEQLRWMRLRDIVNSFPPVLCRSFGVGIIEMGSVDIRPTHLPWLVILRRRIIIQSRLAHLGVDSEMPDVPSSTRGDLRPMVNYSFDLLEVALVFLFCSYPSCKTRLNTFPTGDLGI